MDKMGSNYYESSRDVHAGSPRVTFSGQLNAFSGPLSIPGGWKSAGFTTSDVQVANADDDNYVEITLDVRDDSVAVHSVRPASAGGAVEFEDPGTMLLARKLERRPSFGSSAIRTASNRFRQVSQELRRLASFTNRAAGAGRRLDRSRSAATHALKGLKFITKADLGAGWAAVDRRFDELADGGLLHRGMFGQCIGMRESKEFAERLFDALARRRHISRTSINKAELYDFWEQISNQSFDSRLQTFFDMHVPAAQS